MRLIRAKIKNFRCYQEEVVIEFDDLTVFVGRNDSGKSAVLDALDIFFNEKVPEADDRCVHSVDREIRIACEFDQLPRELVIDTQHPTSLEQEHLLNRSGNLEILRIFSCPGAGKPKLQGVYSRAQHPTAENYSDLLSLTNAKLKQRARDLGVDLGAADQTVNTDLRRAIWAHAGGGLNLQDADLELKAEASGKVWEQLKKSLPVFALFKADRSSTDQDDEAQDPMKAAIKEAIRAQEATLDEIAATVKRQVQEIANRTVAKIREMSPELANQLTPRVSNKSWDSLFSVSLTGDEEIPVNKRGSGTRRLILLNFFRAKAEQEAETKGANVIYAIEEPETSQHPHNQRMLIDAFEDLAERPGCQVILTTHTPVLARRFPQSSLRHVAKVAGQPAAVLNGREEATLRTIVDSLGVLPDHNIKVFFGVEGRHDINFFKILSKMLRDAGEDIPDLGLAENSGHLLFVPLGGSCLDLWVARLREFNRPEFYVLDRDNPPPAQPKYHAIATQLQARPNCTVWTTGKRELENYIHPDAIRPEVATYAGTGADFEDVPALVARALHETAGGGAAWAEVAADPEKLGKKVSRAKQRLNSEFAGKMTPDLLRQADRTDEVRGWLRAVGAALRA